MRWWWCAVVMASALAGCRSLWIDETLTSARLATLVPTVSGASGAAPDAPAGAALDDYIALALARNAGLQAAAAHWRAALERVPQVTALPDPRVEYAGFLEPIETRTGPQRHQVMLMQTVPWLGKLARQGDRAAAMAEAAWWRVEARRRAVAREVADAWYELGFLGRAIALVENHLALLSRLEPVVQARIRAGGRQDDLLRLQVEIGRVQNEVATLGARTPVLRARLAAACDLRPDAPLPMPELTEIEAAPVDAAALTDRLATENPELAALRQAVVAAEQGVRLADLGPVPDVTFGLTWFVTGRARMRGTAGSGDDPVALRLGLNLPVQLGRYGGAMREAGATRVAAEAELRDRANRLATAVAVAAFQADDGARQLALYRDTLLPRARQALQLAETAYRTGSGDLLGIIDSERMLLTFERAFWRAIADWGQAGAALTALVGTEAR